MPTDADREAAEAKAERVNFQTVTAYDCGYQAGRLAGMEQAAVICQQQAKEFLSPQYAIGQPLSSFQERFACSECATAIRAAKEGV